MTTWYEEIPKVELHVHLEGAIPHAALLELIKKYGGDPSVPDVAALARRFEYKDFPQFIDAWIWKNQFLREYDDFTHIAELFARDLAQQNIHYAEVFFSPSLFVPSGLEVQELAHAIRVGLSRVPEVEINLIADLVRDYGPESEAVTLAQLDGVKDQGVIGVGIGGSEHRFPPEPFQGLYEEARRMGFHTNAHAGEAAGAESVWGALRCLRVERVGHATLAGDDPQLVDYLADHQIPVELCPMSNVRTGVIQRLADHPIRAYFDRGLLVSVNTDDPKMFGTSLAQEYRQLVQECGFSRRDVCRLVLLGIDSSWLSSDRKESLTARFKREPCWVE